MAGLAEALRPNHSSVSEAITGYPDDYAVPPYFPRSANAWNGVPLPDTVTRNLYRGPLGPTLDEATRAPRPRKSGTRT